MYRAASRFLAEHHPERLSDFESAFRGLRTRRDFHVKTLRGLFDAVAVDHVREQIHNLPEETLDKRELLRFGRLIKQDVPAFSALAKELAEDVSHQVGEIVEPGYNFISLYNNLGKCELHLDSPFSKWTLDICIDQSGEWPILISDVVDWPEHLVESADFNADSILHDPGVQFRSYSQRPGDALLFSGSSQWHYRNRIPACGKRNFAHLLFLHYFPKGMLELTRPETWAEHFGIPELSGLVGSCASSVVTEYSDYRDMLAPSPNRSSIANPHES